MILQLSLSLSLSLPLATYRHTDTHTYILIYTSICVCMYISSFLKVRKAPCGESFEPWARPAAPSWACQSRTALEKSWPRPWTTHLVNGHALGIQVENRPNPFPILVAQGTPALAGFRSVYFRCQFLGICAIEPNYADFSVVRWLDVLFLVWDNYCRRPKSDFL